MSHKTRIVVTVDDFGPRPEVNERALELFEAGLVTRFSAIVNIPWPAHTVDRLKQKSIPVGLHLNISSGSALSPREEVPSLVNREGNFLPENKSSNLSHISSADIAREFKAQLQHFHAMGLELSHLDNHRPEIYFFPHLLNCALDLAKDENVSLRHPLRNFSRDEIRLIAQKYHCSEDAMGRLKAHYDDAILQRGLQCPDYFASDGSFGGFEHALHALSHKNIKGYCEIAVHLEGEMGKSNFDFMLSDRFRTWKQHLLHRTIMG